jgi:hypothetical protein
MAMFGLVTKVLLFVWAAQLVWFCSLLLRRPVKRLLHSVLTSEDAPARRVIQAVRSSL